MKITTTRLKEIIKEELKEFGGVAGSLAAQRPPRAPVENMPDSEIQSRAMEFFMNLGIEQKISLALVSNIAIPDLVSVMDKIPKIDTAAEEEAMGEATKKESNPWAICTASVGRKDKEKYEKCVKGVKRESGGKQ